MRGIRKGRGGRPGDAVLITGAGSGIGMETAVHLAGRGFQVYGTVLGPEEREQLEAAAAGRGVQLRPLEMDITDREAIAAGIAKVLDAAGAVFGLVNNAGIGLRGCLEDCSEEEIEALFETNVLGTVAITRAVIPHMRAAGCGRIVTVSSVGGRVCGFGVALYCASKFAQEGLGEGLAQELAPMGIQSVIVEPGILKTTRWSLHRGTAAGANDPASPYHGLFWASEAIADKLVERSETQPEDVAATIARALSDPNPRMRYVVGRGASVVIALRRYLPESLFERLYFAGHIRRLERRTREDERAPVAETLS